MNIDLNFEYTLIEMFWSFEKIEMNSLLTTAEAEFYHLS